MSETARPFAHLAAENAPTYRAVLGIFTEARERYAPRNPASPNAAPPHRRTAAPPHRRTAAPPHRRRNREPRTAPPRPSRSRWQPLRAGLVDLYHYDDEEFRSHDGRLLLRGNNGAGKSKVLALALTLPFLLDADLPAHRVEPDGDRGERMEWNLLLGGAHPHTERTGYTWLEPARSCATTATSTGAGCRSPRQSSR